MSPTSVLSTQPLLIIGGEAVAATDSFEVINPATGEVFATAPSASLAQLDHAVAGAVAAFPSWKADEAERRRCLERAADLLEAQSEAIAAVLTAEQGKPLPMARGECAGAARIFRAAATRELPREVVRDDERAKIEVVGRPLGVVAAITPWNYPVALAANKMSLALLTGNTVVVKPSPFTSLSTLLMGEAIRHAFPAGTVSILSGGDDLGAALASHEGVRKISFTGSVEAGKSVAAGAASDLKRVTLELGGNDAAILLDDFDVATQIEGLFWGAFVNSGQVCAAVKRVYAPEALFDDVVSALAARADATKVGPGTEDGVELGPLQNATQFRRVGGLVADALSRGGHAAAGGGPLERPGYFFAPTIVAGAPEDARLVTEEQFGPALPVMPYRTVDEAVAAANATQFGLDGSVWGRDTDRAMAVGELLECGTTWVNTHAVPLPDAPFGGRKWSGIGSEGGRWGLESFTDPHTLYTPRSTPGRPGTRAS